MCGRRNIVIATALTTAIRVARAVSAVETRDREAWEQQFFQVLRASFL
jgi:hypothetical protein